MMEQFFLKKNTPPCPYFYFTISHLYQVEMQLQSPICTLSFMLILTNGKGVSYISGTEALAFQSVERGDEVWRGAAWLVQAG